MDLLDGWVSGKLLSMPIGDNALVKMLVHRLKDDASAAGFTLAHLEPEENQTEQFMKETLLHIAEPGSRESETAGHKWHVPARRAGNHWQSFLVQTA